MTNELPFTIFTAVCADIIHYLTKGVIFRTDIFVTV